MNRSRLAAAISFASGLALSSTALAQITNGGFESGDFTGWTVDSTNPSPSISTDAHGGTYSAFLGSPVGTETPGDSSIHSTTFVPAAGQHLLFWFKTATTDSITFDWQDAYIQDSGGATLQTIFHICQTAGWTLSDTDLSAYVGQTIRVAFLVHGDNAGDATSMEVDDVATLVPASGACCLGDGSCTSVTASACAANSGIYRGDNISCASSICSGACCVGGACQVSSQQSCTSQGGLWQNAATCAGVQCPSCVQINGGFESGAFPPGWTQFGNLGFTAVNTGAFVGVSPHGGSYESHFGPVGSTGGIQQTITASPGDHVTIDFWYACNIGTPNSFSADIDGQNLVSFSNDAAHTAWTEFTFTVAVANANPTLSFTTQHDPSYIYLDDISTCIQATGPSCYANCDGSTGHPFLNVGDFTCFLQKFGTGNAYANCDGSTNPPTLNVQDFTCFLQKFGLGCSAP